MADRPSLPRPPRPIVPGEKLVTSNTFSLRHLCHYANLEMDHGWDLTAKRGPADVLPFERRKDTDQER